MLFYHFRSSLKRRPLPIMRMRIFFLFSFLFFSGYFQSKAQVASVLDILAGVKIELNEKDASVWKSAVTASLANKSITQEMQPDSAFPQNDIRREILSWIDKHLPSQQPEVPFFSHFNKAFGLFAETNLPAASIQQVITEVLFLYALNPHPAFLEMAGDLLLMKGQKNELKYLAAFAYEKAAENSSLADAKKTWQRKSVFSLEDKILGPAYYDKIREYRFKEAFRAERKRAEAQTAMKFPEGNIENWPQEISSFANFAEKQMDMDRESSRKLVVSKEIILPGVDASAVKRNVKYNLYALLIFTALGGMVFYVLRQYNRATKKQAKEDLDALKRSDS